ncbi:MAG: Asp-tRNA(Asn)/Glu-tRNA(Gln) amidotransferase subunit GatC [Coriobacteriia bacterium]|nr:Asp-tRNA(Asn)/Glu-tRNA(Gln) amidotransferase subunit GatC [Coriobacteriia bacterium]
MAQHLTEKDVRRIAEYARIGLTDEELVQMTVDLNNVIDTLKPITEFDLEGVEPTFHPIGDLSNVMREDVEVAGFSQKVALSNAPKQMDGCFLIPSILGEGGDR